MTLKKILILLGLVIVAAAVLAACGSPQQQATPTSAETAVPTQAPVEVPFEAAWRSSGHADTTAEAFNHWNSDDPAVVAGACAKCHSGAGYQDFLGADGSAAGTIEATIPAQPNPGINCTACHNPVTVAKTSVVFPSGIEIKNLGDDSRCMECHQGRESKVSVDQQIADFKATEALDTVVAPIKDDQGKDVKFGFRNIHYFAAAATLYGTEVKGGYEYDGKAYDAKHDHVPGYATCTGCHDPQSRIVAMSFCEPRSWTRVLSS